MMTPSGSWLWTSVDAGVRSLLMAAVVGAGLRVLRVSNVMARKVAWTLVLCVAMMMPLLAPWADNHAWLPVRTAGLPVQSWRTRLASHTGAPAPDRAAPLRQIFPTRVEAVPAADSQPAQTDLSPRRVLLAGDHFPAPAIALDGKRRTSAKVNTSSLTKAGWGATAFLIYAAIAFAFLIRIAVGCIATTRLWMRASPAADLTGQPRGGRIRWSRHVSSPVTVGSGILLPENYASWDGEKLRIVLAHESSHVRQGDFYLQLCAAVYAALFWFSPLGWWLKRVLCDLSEAISDRAAVNEAVSHASYAQVLLEFAAMPRTIPIGVAMARTGRLSHRIDRLLDEGSFRRAFAGGRARIAAAALLVPLALLAATSLRVQAAGQEPAPPAAPSMPSPPAMPSMPAPPASAGPSAPAFPAAPAEPPAADQVPVAPPPPAEPAVPEPPPQGAGVGQGFGAGSGDSYSYSMSQSDRSSGYRNHSSSCTNIDGEHFSCTYDDGGESYALVSGNSNDHVSFSGDWTWARREGIDKARKIAHGDFLWFTRNGKSYLVDDPAIVSSLIAMYKPMEDLGRQQEELGRQQEELGRQQEALGERMGQASIPTPDVSKELAQLRAALAELDAASGKTMNQEQLAGLQEKLAELQGRLGGLQGEVGSRQGEIGRQQGELGEKQGKLGEQQGRLGAEQGRIAREADRKVKSVIDESLRNGKARPVE